MMDIDFKDKAEEEDVTRKMATGLITVFKDNPKFTAALLDLIKS